MYLFPGKEMMFCACLWCSPVVAVSQNNAAPVAITVVPLPGGGLSLRNGAVRVDASPGTLPLLRFFVLNGSAATEVLRSYHAPAAPAGPTDVPLYSRTNLAAGYRILLHDQLQSVVEGPGSTAAAASLVLEASAPSSPSSALCAGRPPPFKPMYQRRYATVTAAPPLPGNCTALGSARLTIGLRVGSTSFTLNVTYVPDGVPFLLPIILVAC